MALRTIDIADGFASAGVPGDIALPAGAATEAKQNDGVAKLTSIDNKTPVLGQALAAVSVPVVLTAIQVTALTPPAAITGFALETTQSSGNTLLGAVAETAPASDTASSGLNGRLQRIAQRITSLISLFPTSIGQKIKSNSLSVTLASDQGALTVISGANTNGTIVNTTLTATTATANVAPANAVGFFIEASSDNTHSIRWAIGSTASPTVGMRFESGRSGDSFIPCTGTVSVCAEVSGTNSYQLQWVLSV